MAEAAGGRKIWEARGDFWNQKQVPVVHGYAGNFFVVAIIVVCLPVRISKFETETMIFPATAKTKLSLFALALAATGLLRAQSGGALPIAGTMPEDVLPDLKRLITSALKQSPQMIQNEIAITQSEAARYASSAQRLPQVNANVSYAWNNVSADRAEPPGGFKPGDPRTNRDKSSGPYYGVSVSQPIFTWYALTNQVKIADIAIKISEKNYAEAYRGLVGTLRTQYLGLIYTKIARRNQRYNLAQTERLLNLDEARLKSGAMAPAELIGPRTGYAYARLAMARTDESYARAKAQLARLAGVEALDDDAIPLEAPKWSGDPAAAGALAARLQRDGVEATLQGQINALRIKDAELNYKVAQTRLYPKFSFSASASQYNSQTVTTTSVSQAAAFSTNYGISGSWTIFDGFATRGAKLSALALKRYYEQAQKSLSVQVTEQVQAAAQGIDFSAQSLEMVETARAGVLLQVERVKDEFKRGSVTEDTVTSVTAQLYGQDAAVVAARIELLGRWIELVSLVGSDPVLNQLPARYVH